VNEDLRKELLGDRAPDPGCDMCFEVLDQYAEALLRRDDVQRLFPHVIAHLAGCPACREDTEGLLAVLRREAFPDGPR